MAGNVIKFMPEKLRRATALALIGAAALTASGCGKEEIKPTPTQARKIAEQYQTQETKSRLKLKLFAIKSAELMLKKMSNPKSGVEPVSDGTISNEENIYHRDEDTGRLIFNPIYSNVPLMNGIVDQDNNRLSVYMVGQHTQSGKKPQEATAYTVFNISPHNSIYKLKGQPKPADIKKALEDGSTNVIAVSASAPKGYAGNNNEVDEGVWLKDSKVFDYKGAGDFAVIHDNPITGVVVTDPAKRINTIENTHHALKIATHVLAQDPPLG